MSTLHWNFWASHLCLFSSQYGTRVYLRAMAQMRVMSYKIAQFVGHVEDLCVDA